MTTVVVVRKNGHVAVGSDSLVTFGDTRLSHRFEANEKVFTVAAVGGPSFVATAGTVAHFPALRKALAALPAGELKLHSKDEVYDTFLKLHPILKDTFFLQTKEEDADPYESMQFSVLVANSAGIFGLYSYREVFEFKEFWGIGSGRSFSLGAMHAVYAKAKTAAEVAQIGIEAGCEFDKSSGGPINIVTMKMGKPAKTAKPSTKPALKTAAVLAAGAAVQAIAKPVAKKTKTTKTPSVKNSEVTV
jgi:ATP-dependent HslUV protease, peptidase subunit HslV